MSQYLRIDKQKAHKKWGPVLENMGVSGDKLEWMSEYAEYHQINENAYVNAFAPAGMGSVINPTLGSIPGLIVGANANGVDGSGDLGQNLLPVAMKIAAQTIGLDLVAVKPSPGPKIDLLYIDFVYDDLNRTTADERPQVFKLQAAGGTSSVLAAAISSDLTRFGLLQYTGGITNGRIWYGINGASSSVLGSTYSNGMGGATVSVNFVDATSSKDGVVEFLGFSRIDGFPIFRAYRQSNQTAPGGPLLQNSNPYTFDQNTSYAGISTGFDQTRNTFNPVTSMVSQFTNLAGISFGGSVPVINLVSTLEDQIPGFSANWFGPTNSFAGKYPMERGYDDNTYSGIIGPKISSKSIAVGTIEVSSALRRTEIEDIKANTGMDIVQKMESILVNELSQTISKQIISKLWEMADLNRSSAPLFAGTTTITYGGVQTIFDLDTAYVTLGGGPGGETTHAIQRKLITKMLHASNFLATEGRVGPAQFAVTNGGIAAALMDIIGYTINPVKSKLSGQGQLYPIGTIGDIQIYVDPYMKYNDNRILLGRKNNPDQPGVIFVPYLMAQSISVISEATFAPRMLLRSRYAVTEVGFFPQSGTLLGTHT
jgi:hypothetical protein